MARVGIEEAATRLGMTIGLIQWFVSYAPKSDGIKLKMGADHLFDTADLEEFDKHLWSAWPSRRVPEDISRELRREALGHCACCSAGLEVMQEAHIRRKGKEVPHYTQHPHNLILLCPTCHTRYDRGESMITCDVLQTAKRRLLSRLLEDVKRDMAVAEACRAATAQVLSVFNARFAASQPLRDDFRQAWMDITGPLPSGVPPVTDVTTPAQLVIGIAQAGQNLRDKLPATSGLLRDVAQNVLSPPTGWSPSVESSWYQEPRRPGRCIRCSSPAGIDTATCTSCGEPAHKLSGREGAVVQNEQGRTEIHTENVRGDTIIEACANCGSTTFDVDYDSMCSYCEHVFRKSMDDE